MIKVTYKATHEKLVELVKEINKNCVECFTDFGECFFFLMRGQRDVEGCIIISYVGIRFVCRLNFLEEKWFKIL